MGSFHAEIVETTFVFPTLRRILVDFISDLWVLLFMLVVHATILSDMFEGVTNLSYSKNKDTHGTSNPFLQLFASHEAKTSNKKHCY